MKIRSSRLYSYPVLSEMYDDYINSNYSIKVKAFKKTKNLLISINCILDNDDLSKLIDAGKAKIVCHFECQKTKLRYTKNLKIGENNFEISNSDINEQLQIVSFIVASEDIKGYYSTSFNRDYGTSRFDIETGSVLAISNQPDIPIEKNIYDLSNVPSIISIVPYNSETDHKIYIDMDDNNKIMVRLQKKDYQRYSELGRGVSDYTPILHSMLIIPALTHVFEILKSDIETFNSYEDKRWFKSLSKKFEALNKKLDYEELKNQDSLSLAQEIIECPIEMSLKNLLSIGGN
ncbi:MAG: hypothetical protein GX265_06010 [Mollicutes bacterium]|nr:hypothetical protein [Mollicutes bacterium]